MKAKIRRCFLTIISGIIILCCPAIAKAQIVTTIAGSGIMGFGGDGGPAVYAAFDRPFGLGFDRAWNLYISDNTNNRIRMVDVAGTITTIAGSTAAGYAGDGGSATAAILNNPSGIAIDKTGNLFIADCYNNRIRKIDTSGIISTIAGNGSFGFSGDGGPATSAKLYLPISVATDSAGNLYIADKGNHSIRKINSSGIITTIAGTGTLGYTGDGGPATAAKFHDPAWVATWHRNVYIADYSNGRIRMIDTMGQISTVAGSGSLTYSGDGGPATDAGVYPSSVFLDSAGNIFIGDQNRVRKVNSSGVITTIAGNGSPGFSNDNCAATNAMFHTPLGMAVNLSGNLCIADYINNRVRRLNGLTGLNHPPVFTGGHSQSITVCENQVDSINAILAVADVDTGQSETWSMVVPPIHGTANGAFDTPAILGTIIPKGLYYAPPTGFTGIDSFKIMVTDCAGGIDSAIIHVTVVNCALATPAYLPKSPEAITVFPDPNNGTFTIIVSTDTGPLAVIRILNMLGEKIMEVPVPTGKPTTLKIETGAGIYFLKSTTAHGTNGCKIVVN